MNIKITNLTDCNLNENDVEILIKTPILNENVLHLIDYINQFETHKFQNFLINSNNNIIQINLSDIICFYSDKKYNYCKTKEKNYKIKKKLYEVEKLDPNFIRISKGCIANIAHIKCFDISETGKIIVIFDDESKEYVSRRKIKSIMDLLDERSI